MVEVVWRNGASKKLTTDSRQLTPVVILCGSGNNGGDGLVVARVLHNQGRDVKVFLSAKPEDLKGDARINYKSAKKAGVGIYPLRKFLTHNASLITRHSLIIVDALLGTGLNKDVKAPLSDVIKKTNRMRCPVVSVDIPSGISSDTGQVMGCAIKAQYTISFGLPKRGLLLYPGAEHTGRLFIRNIGFPQRLLKSGDIEVNLIQENDILSMLPERPRYSHKGTYGHVLLIAGSKGKTGAAFMAAKSCLRTGAGLVTIGVPESLTNIFQSRVTEEMVLPLPDKGNGTLSYEAFNPIFKFLRQKASVLAIGPGISVDEEISGLISLLITRSSVPLVIDADGINAISGGAGVLKKSRVPLILTPHPGEMARLMSSKQSVVNSQDIEKDRINIAMTFAKKTTTCLVLKGVPTIISTPDARAFINPTGNSGMATAGTGDVLTGMISALLAQGLTPRNASILGVYMHGLIGDVVAKKKGKHSLIASDMINAIPTVFKSIKLPAYKAGHQTY
ncbi:MAG: NAD(P)H-hydrate dehydratase [Candidatus Mariimomonas ferrooxydans]